MMPSHTRETSTGDTPAPLISPSRAADRASMAAPTPSDSQEPKGPKVMTNITSMAHKNRGIARIRWVTTRSIRSLRVGLSALGPLVTQPATTRWMY